VKHNGVVIYDEQLVSPRDIGLKQKDIPATNVAIEEFNNKQVANIIILGTTVEMTKIATNDALIAAIEETVEGRFKDSNLKAVDTGFKLGRMRLWQ